MKIIGILINILPYKSLLTLKKMFKTEFLILSTALLTTQSTTGYLLYGILIIMHFALANTIFQSLFSIYPDLSITVVTNGKNFSYFKRNERLQLLSGISDEQLRNLYRTSKCMFLPLESFTANNAILEAAAMGCPIIVATNKIDTSYLNANQIDFLPLKIESVLKFLTIFINKEIDLQKVKSIHEYIAENYSWNVIAKKTKILIEDFK